MSKPTVKPSNPNFGSGPTSKRPGYKVAEALADAPLGRSHRSGLCKGKIVEATESCKKLLGLPDDYLIGIVPGSDTGAFEMAMWTMLGPREVDVCCWDAFGKGWLTDATSQLKSLKVNAFEAPYGQIPDFSQTNPDHDILFTWNGTTSGVMVPNGDWISDSRGGLTMCDATSAVFAMDMPWSKLDVVTFSWQKVLGGEAAHGMLILSPRAVERIESNTPAWPVPKVFRLKSGGKFLKDVFAGGPINTISMMCVEDFLDALKWVGENGGSQGLIKLSQGNLAVLEEFVDSHPWIEFLAKDKPLRSNTSVCLVLPGLEAAKVKEMTKLLATEGVAYDIDSYRDAPAGIRIWCGATVEAECLRQLLPWLEWAHAQITA